MSAHRFDARAFRLQSVEIDLRELLLRLLACAALVAAVTVAIALLETQVPVLGLSVLYLFAVLPVAILWGLGLAILVSVASMLSFNFFFLEPRHTLTLQDSSYWFALGCLPDHVDRRQRSRSALPPPGDRVDAARGDRRPVA